MSFRKLSTWLLALVVIALALPALPASAQNFAPPRLAPTTYIVRPGDTLFSIATRYHTNAATLAQLNGIVNPTMIYVGQLLAVPATPTAPSAPSPTAIPAPAGDMVYIVQPGETLYRIALHYNTTAWNLAAYNKLDNTTMIYAGQRLMIPSGSKHSETVPALPSLPDPFVSVDIAPLPVIQGNTIAVTVLTSRDVALSGTFLDWTIPFAKQGSAYYALIGIHAMQKPGLFPMTITASDPSGRQTYMTASIQVLAGKFQYETINVAESQQALLAPDIVTAERDQLASIFSAFTPERYWSGLFTRPTNGNITSAFGSRRDYAGFDFNKYHEGIDFWGVSGAPVYAPADGVVVLAQPLKIRGNALIIDHGWGVYSGLYHLSQIDVTVGQRVMQGQVVAKIGSTGLSTGSHLHWDVRIRNMNVDPLQWTRRIFP
jgi:murein DD-endopeptidase MepM/ murein hydrolase activator NlpD